MREPDTFRPKDRARVINPLAPDYGRLGTVEKVEFGKLGLVWLKMDEVPNVIDRGLVGFPRECLLKVGA